MILLLLHQYGCWYLQQYMHGIRKKMQRVLSDILSGKGTAIQPKTFKPLDPYTR